MLTPLSISDMEAEALLAGDDAGRDELADVAEVLAVIKTAGNAEAHKDFAHLIAPAALESRATPLSRFAEEQAVLAKRDKVSRVASRVAIGAAALFMLVVSTTGLAFAANGSKPGDWLYGLDRAAEVIGIGNGGPAERIAEAQGLAATGVPGGGLAHAAAVLAENEATQGAGQAVAAAAVRLQQGPQGAPEAVANEVDILLSYLADYTPGPVDGEVVSRLARLIGGPTEGEAPSNSESAPGHDPSGPGNSEDAPGPAGEGPPGQDPESPGNSENAPGHDPDVSGNSENAPGHDEGEEGPGSSGSAPGQNTEEGDPDAPGSSGGAPGQNTEEGDPDAPGSSGSAPGQTQNTP